MKNQSLTAQTLKVVSVLIELAASVRAMLATFAVTMNVSNNDLVFSAFTCAVIELAFLVAMFSIGTDASAPIAALIALLFSAAMQYLEVLALAGAMSANEKFILRAVIAFAPIIVLFLAYIRRLVQQSDGIAGLVSAIADALNLGDKLQGDDSNASRPYGFDVESSTRKKKMARRGLKRAK